jgi:ribosome-associated toxin RatA of RatAB toxin-antitoxin module
VVPTGDEVLVFNQITDFARYPAIAPDVREVVVHADQPRKGRQRTEWTVNFLRGVMRWTEEEHIDDERMTIQFAQIEGDFDEFQGGWQMTPGPSSCEVLLEVRYDFGIDSLAGIMDPLAERVIKRAICAVLVDITGELTVIEGGEALTDLGGTTPSPGVTVMRGEP